MFEDIKNQRCKKKPLIKDKQYNDKKNKKNKKTNNDLQNIRKQKIEQHEPH
jgi:hypothetical protein